MPYIGLRYIIVRAKIGQGFFANGVKAIPLAYGDLRAKQTHLRDNSSASCCSSAAAFLASSSQGTSTERRAKKLRLLTCRQRSSSARTGISADRRVSPCCGFFLTRRRLAHRAHSRQRQQVRAQKASFCSSSFSCCCLSVSGLLRTSSACRASVLAGLETCKSSSSGSLRAAAGALLPVFFFFLALPELLLEISSWPWSGPSRRPGLAAKMAAAISLPVCADA